MRIKIEFIVSRVNDILMDTENYLQNNFSVCIALLVGKCRTHQKIEQVKY
jgi:hypothetical protein